MSFKHVSSEVLTASAITTVRAADTSLDILRKAIIEGELVPGQRLPEEEIAGRLGISRTPLRRAFAMLEAEGLITGVPNHGVYVRSYAAEEIDDLYRLRAVLEGHGAARAALVAGPKTCLALRKSCERLEKIDAASMLRMAIDENFTFHNLILKEAGSERLQHMVRHVVALPVLYTANLWSDPRELDRSCAEHRALVDVISAGDADAAEMMMRAHILRSKDAVLARIEFARLDVGSGGKGGR